MPVIPTPQSSTVRAIYKAYEDSNESWDSLGISVGELGTECDRALFYSFRWATPVESHEGRVVRIFRRGDIEEDRLVVDLEQIGVEVFGLQDRIRLVSGHVRGKIDGRLLGVPEAPKTEHLFEAKSSNDANFKVLVRDKCKKAQPKHYVQCQIGMHCFGLTRALYVVTNKNDEHIYAERIEYDIDFCLRLLARAQRIIGMDAPPKRINEKPEFFGCSFCKHKPVCHEGAWSRVTCRSCIYASPEMHGNAAWSCARWQKPISFDEQKVGCGAHLHLPGLVHGEQVDADEESGTITYKMNDGETWVDGGEG